MTLLSCITANIDKAPLKISAKDLFDILSNSEKQAPSQI